MIKHFVAFRFKPDVPEERRRRVLDGLNEFPRLFPAMRNWNLGRNISRRDDTFEYAFSVEFDGEQPLLDYLASDAHEKFVTGEFRPYIESRTIVTCEAPEASAPVAKADLSKMPWERMREGVSRKTVSGAGITVQLAELRPGHALNPHRHRHEQIAYILSGTADFHVGGETYRLGPGGCLVIPPHVEHYAQVVGDEPVLNLDAFVPRRD